MGEANRRRLLDPNYGISGCGIITVQGTPYTIRPTTLCTGVYLKPNNHYTTTISGDCKPIEV